MKTNFSACFRRFHRGKSFSNKEIDLIEALERQRHSQGRVRAVINDPGQEFEPILLAYIAYIQHLDQRDAIIVTPQGSSVAPKLGRTLRAITATHRHYQKIYGHTLPIGQILLLNSHETKKLDQILARLFAYATGPNSLIIIHGADQPATPFSQWLAKSKQSEIWRGGVPASPSILPNPPHKNVCLSPELQLSPINNSQLIINNSPKESRPTIKIPA